MAQVRHRVGGHGDRFVERRAQRLGDVQVRRLRNDTDDLCAGLDEVAEGLVGGCLPAGTARRAERDECRGLEPELLGGPDEELLVFRVRTRPAALYVWDAQVVELLGDAQLVVDRQRYAFLLRTVAQRRVVDVDSTGEVGLR